MDLPSIIPSDEKLHRRCSTLNPTFEICHTETESDSNFESKDSNFESNDSTLQFRDADSIPKTEMLQRPTLKTTKSMPNLNPGTITISIKLSYSMV
jgi:hypothetical protein